MKPQPPTRVRRHRDGAIDIAHYLYRGRHIRAIAVARTLQRLAGWMIPSD